jgi:DNA polymerase I
MKLGCVSRKLVPIMPHAVKETYYAMNTSPQPKTIVLVDGHALAYRMYFALERTQMRDAEERPTWAPYGFFNAIYQLLNERQPDALAFAFDVARESFRTRMYSEYKANRASMPDDMRTQMQIIYEGIEALGLPVFRIPDVEADDVIGTLSRRMVEEHPDWHVDILTGDQDSFQLVDAESRVNILIPSRNAKEGLKPYDWNGVIEKWGVTPAQVADFKGLKGDASDNIPGVKGIGDKTAVKLLDAYGTLEAVYENLDVIAPAGVQKKLREGEAMAKLSKELAIINCEVEVPFVLEAAKLDSSHAEAQALQQFFEHHSFRTFARNINTWAKLLNLKTEGLQPTASASNVNDDSRQPLQATHPSTSELPYPAFQYETLETLEALQQAIAEIHALGVCAFDVETTGLNVHDVELVGFGLSWGAGLQQATIPARNILNLPRIQHGTPGLTVDETATLSELKNVYVPLAHHDLTAVQMDKAAAMACLKELLEDESILKIIHNVKYERNCTRHWGLEIKGPVVDTLLMSYVLHPERKHGLKALGADVLGFEMSPISDLIGKGKTQRTFDDVPVQQAAPYGASDTYATWCLAHLFTQQLAQNEGLQSLFYEIENPLANVLADLEWEGIRLDVDHLHALSTELATAISRIETEVQAFSETPVNLNSPKQVGEFLFDTLAISPGRKTATKSYSTDHKVLESLRDEHAVIPLLLDYRQVFKLKSTYVDPLPLLVKPQTGRVHTSFNQFVTATGRLSSSDPNLQNIPVRSEWGARIREAFVPRTGWKLISADYSQIELRMVAHLSQDANLLKAFQEGRDIHTATAALVMGIPEDAVTKEQRYAAKAVNFGIVYGQTAHGLSQQLSIPRAEAQEFIERYFATYPGVKRFIETTIAQAHETGFGETMFGRQRNLSNDLNSHNRNIREFAERASFNTPVQGAAAELLKLAMLELHEAIQREGLQARILLQVHDELVLEAPEAEVETVLRLIDTAMVLGQPLQVPLVVDTAVGNNWGEIG